MVARLPEAPSLAAQGMLGQTEARWALNHGHLRGRAGSPPGRKGWSCLRPPSPCTPPHPQNPPPPCYSFIFLPAMTTNEMILFVSVCSLPVPPQE